MVQRQAAMVAFVDTFRAMAVVFLLVLPLLLVMKRPKHHAPRRGHALAGGWRRGRLRARAGAGAKRGCILVIQ